MQADSRSYKELLPHLFRQEYAKMTAVLCRHFGMKHIEIAEDIASATFLKASEHWAIHGIPENPEAWLYSVANNKAKDYFKHINVFEKRVKQIIQPVEILNEPEFELSTQLISDSQLAMIFAVCHPGNSKVGQICLVLQILCGFSIQEIANAFLAKPETIKKRLNRARSILREGDFQITALTAGQIRSRLPTVLKALYLLFNEGYYSQTNDKQIRRDLCYEAIRNMMILTGHPLTNLPEVNALLALMCFQSSRLDARTDAAGRAVLFEVQDRAQWDNELIDRGNYYLVKACEHETVSSYHLEAAIAYWHTTTDEDNKWKNILNLYNQLLLIEYSPVRALNRTFALAKVYGNQKAIEEAERLALTQSSSYHALLGYLHAPVNVGIAIAHYSKAAALTKSRSEKQTLAVQIACLTETRKKEPA